MKKSTFTLFALLTVHLFTYSQDCLPEGIIFTNQEEIDNFQTNYPGCAEIEGDVEINGDLIINLSGLSVLTSIEGTLFINFCKELTDFSGLENLTTIGENLKVLFNDSLSSFYGLDSLTAIGGNLDVSYNGSLADVNGLNNLSSIGGSMQFFTNDFLVNFEGLNELSTIGYWLRIEKNAGLANLNGLESLVEIGNSLTILDNASLSNLQGITNLILIGDNITIGDNDVLQSLSGLENITPSSINNLTISHNDILSTCNVESICGYILNPNGYISIHGNGDGCYNVNEVADACGVGLSCLPYGNYYFNNQSVIDAFQSTFVGCSELKGSVVIVGEEITNLAGLNSITSIEEDLAIRNSDLLSDCAGLSNLNTIGGNLAIHHNTGLNDLSGLNGLSAIGGDLFIYENSNITSLVGLNNIQGNSIANLYIMENNLLNSCAVKSVCDYLADPGGEVEVYGNAEGCDNEDEIETACDTLAIPESLFRQSFGIYPNPAKKTISIKSSVETKILHIRIFNQTGGITLKENNPENKINVSTLQPGLYFVEIKTDTGIIREKLIIK